MKKTIATFSLPLIITACGGDTSSTNNNNETLFGYWLDDEGAVIHITETKMEPLITDTEYNCISSPYDLEMLEYDSNGFSFRGDYLNGAFTSNYLYELDEDTLTLTLLESVFEDYEETDYNSESVILELTKTSSPSGEDCYSSSRSGDITVNIEFASLPTNFLSDYSWSAETSFRLYYALSLGLESGADIIFSSTSVIESDSVFEYANLTYEHINGSITISQLVEIVQEGNSLVLTLEKALHPILEEVNSNTTITLNAIYSTDQYYSFESISAQPGLSIQDDTGTVIGDSLDLLDVVSIEVSVD